MGGILQNLAGDTRARNYSEVLYSQALRQASQYIRPCFANADVHRGLAKAAELSHSQELSGISHWAQRYLAGPVPVLIPVM